jgi:hypothetical protein
MVTIDQSKQSWVKNMPPLCNYVVLGETQINDVM